MPKTIVGVVEEEVEVVEVEVVEVSVPALLGSTTVVNPSPKEDWDAERGALSAAAASGAFLAFLGGISEHKTQEKHTREHTQQTEG